MQTKQECSGGLDGGAWRARRPNKASEKASLERTGQKKCDEGVHVKMITVVF